jgi:hypothetical protein
MIYTILLLDISKLRSLEILDLAGNSLSSNIFSSLNGLPHLKSLDLSATNLKGSLDITGEYLWLSFITFETHLLSVIIRTQDNVNGK